MDHLQTSHTQPGQVPSQMSEANNWLKMARQNTKHGNFSALQDDCNWSHVCTGTASLVWPSSWFACPTHDFLAIRLRQITGLKWQDKIASTANLPPKTDHVVIQLNDIKMNWRKLTAVQHRLSDLGNNCTRSIVVAKLLQVGSIPFRTSTHLRPATEERKRGRLVSRQLLCLTTVAYHLLMWMCCLHRTLLAHENSQAPTAHLSARRETPTTNLQ